MKNRVKKTAAKRAIRAVAALDVGGTNMRAAVMGPGGEVLARVERPSRVLESPRAVAPSLAALVQDACAEAGVPLARLRGAAVAIAGGVDAHRGLVTQCPQFHRWRNLELGKDLGRALGLRVAVANDADCALLGEQWLGAAKGTDTLAGVFMGTGLGGALVIGGRLFNGPSGMAGEFGHWLYDPDGRLCNCGQTGCYETIASGTGVTASYLEAVRSGIHSSLAADVPPDKITAEQIASAARGGDPAAREAWNRLAIALGSLLSALVMGFSVDRIVIGGKIARAWPLFAKEAERVMKARSFRYPGSRAKLLKAKLGDDAALAGAARLAWQL